MNDLQKISDEDLQHEIERRAAEKIANAKPQKLTNIQWAPLLKLAQEGIDGVASDGYPGKDFDHYIFEQAMECIYGRKVWDWWNKNANY